ncbi:hypothetical protein [Mycobacterium heckeshornense]|uniref:Rv1733c family protein n=1 Tax=Mycobacterium heckeshornense TaxID=110505 RepID=UPI00115684F2|nr:hypothetical protein [Mycobacterium heckeshornense]MCV7034951.1 hypothetical protein [Mycobacterium heckeshornense]
MDTSAEKMETFTLRPDAWPGIRAFSRNPLVRPCDRVEAAVVTIGVLVILITAACAGALGTIVHEARAHTYAQEAESRYPVTATAIEDGVMTGTPQSAYVRVRVRWQSSGVSHVDSAFWHEPVKAGAALPIWIDHDGNRIDAPSPVSRAGIDAVGVAVVTWVTIVLAVVGVIRNVQNRVSRIRDVEWERDIRSLVDNGGHSSRPH